MTPVVVIVIVIVIVVMVVAAKRVSMGMWPLDVAGRCVAHGMRITGVVQGTFANAGAAQSAR